MHYYTSNIGDYARDTYGLSMLQHGALKLLLNVYYHQERPLSFSNKEIYSICRAASKSEKSAIDFILSKFFTLHADGYRNAKADEDIASYVRSISSGRIHASRQNGRLSSGRPRKENGANEETRQVISNNPSVSRQVISNNPSVSRQ